jgi:hypothetical protein
MLFKKFERRVGMFMAPMPSHPHVFKENLEGIDISLTP